VSERFQIAKFDAHERMVFGYANVSVTNDGRTLEDLQGDEIDIADLEKAAYQFVLTARDAGENHKGTAIGKMVESLVITPEKLEAMGLAKDAIPPRWWVGFKLEPDAFEKALKGDYKMFSIQGTSSAE
jgi:hypothetical protein